MAKVEEVSKEVGLRINTAKTKMMIINRSLEGQPLPDHVGGIEVVRDFIYLGAKITNAGSCEPEIRRRIAMGKTAIARLTRIWKNHGISKETKIKLVKTLIFSIVTYCRILDNEGGRQKTD